MLNMLSFLFPFSRYFRVSSTVPSQYQIGLLELQLNQYRYEYPGFQRIKNPVDDDSIADQSVRVSSVETM